MREPTVRDCELVQADWLRAQAHAEGGAAWEDGGLSWAIGPDFASLLFPTEIDPDALARGLARLPSTCPGVGAWLSLDVDATPLGRAGFERGWSPWWMRASLPDVGEAGDPRIELEAKGEHTWYAAAYDGAERRFAGHAWSHLAGDVAGVFDMAVWPQFRRRGLGAGLLRAVCAAAAAAGGRHAVLNATPAGKRLYETCGFAQIGEGITWWLHRGGA
jgi:GNAT superfamily N-acetyltransferase